MEELIDKFTIEKVHKGGAKFDFEKAKWFNHEWIKKLDVSTYQLQVKNIFESKGIINIDNGYLHKVMGLVKDRCILLPDFYTQGHFFFESPSLYDEAPVRQKWDEKKKEYFNALVSQLNNLEIWDSMNIETGFKNLSVEKNIKMGELQMIFRVMLVGSKIGPAVFVIAETIGKDETVKRISNSLRIFI